MALFLNSANVDDVRWAVGLGFVAGVTTNPALMARAGRPEMDVIHDILELTTGPVFYQVTAEEVAARADQARSFSRLAPDRVVIKIPATTENISLAAHLKSDGISCAITAVATPSQVYIATLAGATYAAIYVSRLTKELGNGIEILRNCVAVARKTESPTRILAASLKTVDDVIATLLIEVSDITLPLELLLKLGDHELSLKAIEEFTTYTRATG